MIFVTWLQVNMKVVLALIILIEHERRRGEVALQLTVSLFPLSFDLLNVVSKRSSPLLVALLYMTALLELMSLRRRNHEMLLIQGRS